MKSFRNTLSSSFLRVGKRVLTRPVRTALLRVPLLPASVARALDDIRFVEPDVLRFVANTVRAGWCCMDVGAHCGTVSARLARLVSSDGLVVAVEPIPANADLLERNLRVRGLLTRCVIVRAAVGGTHGRVAMVRGDHSTTWRITPTREDAGDPREFVDMLPLDIIAAGQRAPEFVKVDVEGAEVDLFAGATGLRDRARPIWLVEMHSPDSWNLLPEFRRADYRTFDLRGAELVGLTPGASGYGHVVFCPAEKLGLLG